MKVVRACLAAVAGLVLLSCSESMHPTGPGEQSGPSIRTDAVSSEGPAGPTVATDKADYGPGETVVITGAGWQPNESISLLLTEDPAAHEPTQWDVTADAAGSFEDRSFVIQLDHIGVAFSLIATGAASADTAQGYFTDGNVTFITNPVSLAPSASIVTYTPPSATTTPCVTGIAVASTLNYNTATAVAPLHFLKLTVPTVANYDYTGYSAPGLTVSPASSSAATVLCISGFAGTAQTITLNYTPTVTAAATKLEITTADLNGVVGQCYALSVQSQESDGEPINVASNTLVNLSTEGPGSFFSDNTCTAAATSVTISSGTNSQAFYYKPTGVGDGAHDITVADNASVLSSDTEPQTVNKAATSVVLGSSPNPSAFGQSVTFTATISVTAPGSGTPTGTVTFRELDTGDCTTPDGTNLGSGAVAAGVATLNYASLAVASHDITACYSGDANFVASDDETTQVVEQATTSLALVSDNDPSEFGEDVKFTATVSVTGSGSGTPTGNVNFYQFLALQSCSSPNGALPFGTDALASGSADVTVDSLAVGTHNVTACYVGDASFAGSASNTVAQDVDPVTTLLTLDVSPVSQQYSDSTVFTATVTPAEVVTDAGTTALVGIVRFYVGAAPTVCSASDPGAAGHAGSDPIADSDNGVATLRYPIGLAAGAYKVTACFYSTSASFAHDGDVQDLTVTTEDVTIYDISYSPNPLIVPTPAGTFAFKVKEKYPETNPALSNYGSIDLAVADVALKGILYGGNTDLDCTPGSLLGTGYARYRNYSCVLPEHLVADTYEAVITVNTTGYYAGTTSSVVQVTDPAAGFSTGGGWIMIGDDKVNFGFMAKATVNNKKTVIQGSLLVIRHGPNGEVYGAKSNVFDGYSIKQITDGYATTFTGKANYSVDGTSVGNFNFTGYAEDKGTPGAGVDKFGLYLASAGNQVATSATLANLVTSAKVLGGGNVQVPQPAKK